MPVKPDTTPRLTVSLEREDYDRLVIAAEQQERSLSWLIRQALKEYLVRHPVAEQLALPEQRGRQG